MTAINHGTIHRATFLGTGFILAALGACFSYAVEPTYQDLRYADVDGHPLRLDLYLPKMKKDSDKLLPRIVWVHGGAWGIGENEERGRQRIRDLAKLNEIKFYVPCSTAWARVREECPKIALQHPNDSTTTAKELHPL